MMAELARGKQEIPAPGCPFPSAAPSPPPLCVCTQVIPTGNGIHRHPLFFIRWVWHRDAKKGHTSHTPAAPHLTLELPALSGSSTGAASEVQPNTSSGQVPADIEAHVVGVKVGGSRQGAAGDCSHSLCQLQELHTCAFHLVALTAS
jgi:hypothetical protein